LALANAVISLPSNKKYVRFTHASFGSPAVSTLLRAIRKGYLLTLPRLTSALVCKHLPNAGATALSHLDRRRQGLDSTTAVHNDSPSSSSPPLPSPETYEDDISNIAESPDAKLFRTADFDASGRVPVPSLGAIIWLVVSTAIFM